MFQMMCYYVYMYNELVDFNLLFLSEIRLNPFMDL